MVKHILGQVIYQTIVLCSFLFAGPYFLPESDPEIENPNKPGFVQEGTEFNELLYGKSRHYTYLFNCFVWLQIFNLINARKIKDEINIFKGIIRAPIFLVILVFIIGFQVWLSLFFLRDLFGILRLGGWCFSFWKVFWGTPMGSELSRLGDLHWLWIWRAFSQFFNEGFRE